MASWIVSTAALLPLLLQVGCAASAPTIDPSTPQPLVIPADASAMEPAGRRIVPRDLLQVTVFEAPELSSEVRVSPTGEIAMPLLGVVPAAGSTPRELEGVLADRLRGTYMHDPRVTVQVREEAPEPIYILGEVNQPGAYGTANQEAVTLLRAVSLARGLKPSAAAGRTVVIRTAPDGSRLQVPVDLGEVLKGRAPDVLLQVSDVVYVPKNTGRAFTLGVIDALVRVLTFRPGF